MTPELILIPGDGIGPEIFDALRPIVDAAAHDAAFVPRWAEAGLAHWQRHGTAITPELLQCASTCQAVLFGAEDSAGYADVPPPQRPASALLQLRHLIGGFANLRPVRITPGMEERSPLRPERVRGTDLVIVRELLGGLYFGQPSGIEATPEGRRAIDTMAYTQAEIERVVRVGFELALRRRRKLCSVDKANVLSCSHLWRETVTAMAVEYPQVELTHLYVDNCAMQLIRNPLQFDVLVMENMFGDILSDATAGLQGSLGLLASASIGGDLGGRTRGLYEPIHGSAPDIAGRGIANPVGSVLSLALALRYSFAAPEAADRLEAAVAAVLAAGQTTPDLGGRCTTTQVAQAICDAYRG
jgi:3-isopropylmalate dehydrogenase